jgi:hypothetical protein
MDPLNIDIIKEWGLQNLSEDEREGIVERIGRLIYQALLVRSLDLLSDEEQDDLDVLLDKDETTPVEVIQFLAEKIPTLEAIRKEEVENLKRDILVH